MTNLNYMLNLLMDLSGDDSLEEDYGKGATEKFERVHIDDGWASGEAMIHYNISCPYYSGDERAMCRNEESNRDLCVECKMKWLYSEVDE